MSDAMTVEQFIAYALQGHEDSPLERIHWPAVVGELSSAITRLSSKPSGGLLAVTVDQAGLRDLARDEIENCLESDSIADIFEVPNVTPPALIVLVRAQNG